MDGRPGNAQFFAPLDLDGDLGVVQVARVEAEELLAARKERVAYYDSLVAEKSDYEERAKTIDGIAKSSRGVTILVSTTTEPSLRSSPTYSKSGLSNSSS